MNNASPSPRPATPASRRYLVSLLGIAVILFVVTLPWQRQQWAKTQRIREETRLQELRVQEITAQQKRANEANIRLQTAPATDVNARLEAARMTLSRGDANAAARLAEQAEAAALHDTALVHDPALAAALAGVFQEAGWTDRALANSRRAFLLAPNNVEVLMRLALIEAQLGWQADSRKHIEQALKIAPGAAEPYLALALLNDQIGARDEAEMHLLKADRLRPGDSRINLLLFQNRLEHRRYDAALATAENALRSHPTDPGLLFARAEGLIERGLNHPGKINLADIQAGQEAVQKYQSFVPADPNVPFILGKALLGQGDEAGALIQWERAYAAQPGQPKLCLNLGRLLVRRGAKERGRLLMENGEKARAEAEQYNQLSIAAGAAQNNPDKHRELARWCQTRKRWSRAILEWEEILRLLPADPEAKREREICVVGRAPTP